MDINSVCLSGHVFNLRVIKTQDAYPVIEARLSVDSGTDFEGRVLYTEYLVRSYGKKNQKVVSSLFDGDFVTIHGRLKKEPFNPLEEGSLGGRIFINVDTWRYSKKQEGQNGC